MKKENRYYLRVANAKNFIQGQLTLYKIQFVETDDNKYLDVMNELNETLETIIRMDKVICRVLKENRELKK
jgi:hypothetical protein